MSLTTEQYAAWDAYRRMAVRLSGRIGQELAAGSGLSEADYDILSALATAPEQSQRSIALRCGLDWEKSRLSHQLRRMEQRGLVSRHDCADDSRSVVVTLTDEGRAALASARTAYDAAVREHVTDALSADQLAALREISETVLDGLGGRDRHLPDVHQA